MLGWIPILGPIIDGIVSVVKGFQNTQVVKYTVDGKVDVAAMQMATENLRTFKDDVGVRLARDLIMFPVAIWLGFVTWDNIVLHVYPNLVWVVERYPPGLEYLPYAILAFLFGYTWVRK